METQDGIKDIGSDLDNTDLSKGIKELMYDEQDHPLEHNPTDIRTDLIGKEVSSMSLANYLTSIRMSGLKPREKLTNPSINLDSSLALNLNILMLSLKRHKISKKRGSRKEIVNLLSSKLDSIIGTKKEEKKDKSIFQKK